MIKVVSSKVNGLVNPVAIDCLTPSFCWQVVGGRQSAYRIDVWEYGHEGLTLLWATGWVESPKSNYIPYEGPSLKYGMSLEWAVSIRTEEYGNQEHTSDVQSLSIGPSTRNDWEGSFIGDPNPFRSEQNEDQPDALDRNYVKEVDCDSVIRGTVYIASYGYHQLLVNGQEVDETVLSPSITYLPGRVRYVAYDVQPLLVAGRNTLTVRMGHGWSAFKHFHLKHGPAFLFQMDISGEDGSTQRIVSDTSWKCTYAERRLLGFWEHSNYGGEFINNGMQSLATFPAEVIDIKSEPKISFDHVEPNKVMEQIPPVSTKRWASNSFQYDFGRNLAGSIQFKVKGPAGCKLLIQYSDKTIETQTFRQFDVFICGGKGEEVFNSRFNYHGFRWVLIHVFYGEVEISCMSAGQIRNSYEETGSFSCSDPLLNSINELTIWTFKNLTLGGYIVDCPTRERWGYGDSFNGVRTALGFFGVENIFRKWLEDWRDVQDPKTGELPNTAPTMMGGGGPAWGSILIQMPWEMYQVSGNRVVLEENYEAGCNFIKFLSSKTRNGILQRYGTYEWGFLGDWNAPKRGMWRGMRVEEEASNYFNNCYFYFNLITISRIARALNRIDDANRFQQLAREMQQSIHKFYWNADLGTYPNGEQTYRALPLVTGQAPDYVREIILNGLVQEIENDQYHLNTGHLGTYFLLECLKQNKLADIGESILRKKTFPGFGYMLERGATTVWEQWDGDNSEIHSCYLSASGWMLEALGGIMCETDSNQKRILRIEPQLSGNLPEVFASRMLPEGEASIAVQLDSKEIHMTLRIPDVDQVVFDPVFLFDGNVKLMDSDFSSAGEGTQIQGGEFKIRFSRE